MEGKTALIIVDVQNDFCPGGALAVRGGDEIIPVINRLTGDGLFYKIIATQDWHPADHLSFASQHPGKNPFDTACLDGIEQTLWPDHCVEGTPGAAFRRELDSHRFDIVIRKGRRRDVDSYSAFMENDRKTGTGLEGCLKGLGIGRLFICGLATDYCVGYSALDAVKLGFHTSVIADACRGIDVPPGTVDRVLRDMSGAGIDIMTSDACAGGLR